MMKYIFIAFLLISTINLFPQSDFPQFGKASYYADALIGKLTASGEKYSQTELTAAHKSLPFGTKIAVTNLTNGKTVILRINDRGPYVKDRIIDVSKKAAEKLDFIENAITEVKIELLSTDVSNFNEDINTDNTKSNYKYYEINAKIVEPDSFGVQIASYTDYGNVLNSVSEFKLNYNYPVIIQESIDYSNRKYRLIVGRCSTKEEAQIILQEIKNNYSDCFILNLSK